MPYKSLKQQRFFHSAGARKAGITEAMVKEWDSESRGKVWREAMRYASRKKAR